MDVKFIFPAEAPTRYEDTVEQRAVLYTVLRRHFNPRSIPADITDLQRIWRARTLALRNAGWGPMLDPTRLDFARNCKPAGCPAYPATRCCGARKICPFCWARQAADIWRRVDQAFENSDTSSDLLERRHTFVRPYNPPDVADGPADYLIRLCRDLTRHRRDLAHDVKAYGAYLLTTIEPISRGWRLQHRQLFQLDASAATPDLRGFLRRHRSPPRAIIARAVANVLRYPRRLLFGDPDRTVFMLTSGFTNTRLRTSALYGSFRGEVTERADTDDFDVDG